MSTEVRVTTQAELDTALTAHGHKSTYEIIVDSPEGVWLTISTQTRNKATLRVDGSARVGRVDGSAHIGWVDGSAHIDRVDGSAHIGWVTGSARVGRVDGSAHIGWVTGSAHIGRVTGSAHIDRVTGSAHIDRVTGSAHIDRVDGSAHIDRVDGSAHIDRAAGFATIHLHDHAVLTKAAPAVAVFLHSQTVTVSGGHIIDVTALDDTDPQTWCDLYGVDVDDEGNAHLFKAVDDQLTAGHTYTPTTYPVGGTVTAPDWEDNWNCGHGLHFSPSPLQAHGYYPKATRFLEVLVPLTGLRPIGDDKAKASTCTVLREVTVYGQPLEETA